MIVLDTHTLIWWVSGSDQLSPAAKGLIEKTLAEKGEVLISVMSAWEIALLVEKGRLVLTMDLQSWLATVQSIEGVRFVPLDVDTAVLSVRMPGEFHPDPADRIIVALARRFAAPLVTADGRMRAYPHVQSVW